MRRFISAIISRYPRSNKLVRLTLAAGVAAGVSVLVITPTLPTEAKGTEYEHHDVNISLKSEFSLFLTSDQIEMDLQERQQRGKPWNSYHSSLEFPQMI